MMPFGGVCFPLKDAKCSETEGFAISTYGRMDPKEIHVLFSVYFDESGTQGDEEENLVIAVSVGRAHQWLDWEKSIAALQRNTGVKKLHMTALYKQLRENFPKLTPNELRQGLHRLYARLLRHLDSDLEFSGIATLQKSDYRRKYLRTGLPRGVKPESAYRICFKYALDKVIGKIWNRYGGDISRITFYIEAGNKHTADAIAVYVQLRNLLPSYIRQVISDTLGVIDNSKKESRRLFAPDAVSNLMLKIERSRIWSGIAAAERRALKKIPAKFFRVKITATTLERTRRLTIKYHRSGREFL